MYCSHITPILRLGVVTKGTRLLHPYVHHLSGYAVFESKGHTVTVHITHDALGELIVTYINKRVIVSNS